MNWNERDSAVVWHPFTQVKTAQPNLMIQSAKDSWLYTEDGKKFLDANSSWWTNLLGHGNEDLNAALSLQFNKIDHVIFAGATHAPGIELSEAILEVLPHYGKVFFSDNGSTSVEVALKMCFQYWFNKSEKRSRFLALDGAYHGDTFGAMSVGQRGYFNEPFEHLFFEVDYLDFPLKEKEEIVLEKANELLSTKEFAGLIVEPLVQGAAGMRIYSADFLNKLISIARKYGTLCVADEVMTGFYRTGSYFAQDQLKENFDITCLSKGLTGGVLPLGLTVATNEVFEAFLSDETVKALLHGHSFTGNALACALALSTQKLLKSSQVLDQIKLISEAHLKAVERFQEHPKVKNVASLGTIFRLEIKVEDENYFSSIRNELYNYFLSKEILLRPLGNVIFINPPYSTQRDELEKIYQAIEEFIQ